jgi:hypothetical protein
MKWEEVADGPWQLSMCRSRVPDGWLVCLVDFDDWASRPSIAFYPAPQHEWNPANDE